LNILEEIKEFINHDIGVNGIISKKRARKNTPQDSYDLKYYYQKAFKVANKLNSIHLKKKHRIKIYNLIQDKTKRNGKYLESELTEREFLLEKFFKH